jgi:DNA-binding beta-propeller fold protein YncE
VSVSSRIHVNLFLLILWGAQMFCLGETVPAKIPATPANTAFSNLLSSYGILETVAGSGAGREDAVNYWRSEFEGKPAASASLSRPHYAMADRAGNIYIADKDSHSVLRIDTNGLIHTHSGTHVAGFNGDGPMPATQFQLKFPNALWVRADGTVYVLDTDNGRVCRIATDGVATTLFQAKKSGGALDGGRMLWVKDDESLAYFGNETRVRRWMPGKGVETYASGFKELGTFYVESGGDLIVADRAAHCIYRVHPDGQKIPIAGNGRTPGGGDGFPALQTGLKGPRGIWPGPGDSYFFLLHDGSQLWYMDPANTMHLLLNGSGGKTHSGDGSYFYNPSAAKISEGRSVSVDYDGNIILCESDYGYIRRIRFQPTKGK